LTASITQQKRLHTIRRVVIESSRMDISFNCPRCNQHLAVEESGAGMTVNCPSCNERINIPPRTASPPPPVSQQNPLCRTCGQGTLIKLTKFRMSAPVVVIGFVLLIPSVIGMLFGVFMLFVTGVASKQTSALDETKIRAQLVAQNIPDPIVNEVVSGRPVSGNDLASLTSQQQSAVHDAESSRLGQTIGGGAATVIVGGFSMFVIIASFVGGLLGWLLIMRKRVLQCVRCGAVVPLHTAHFENVVLPRGDIQIQPS
jgi:DNA-directed RNA polymerase subunit RPC12/RpoP